MTNQAFGTYLDHNATTPVSPLVINGVADICRAWGNPSSIHWAGRKPKQILRETRAVIADYLGVSSTEIIFNSGGSEGNTTAIKSVFEIAKNSDRCEFITTQVEHPSVLKVFKWIEAQGLKVHFIGVDRQGRLDIEHFDKALSKNTALVSVMFANNETGLILPIRQLIEKTKAAGALFHMDAVQALGKLPLDLSDLAVDYATFSAHKFYALKGTGFMFVRRGNPYTPLIFGGAQERTRRGGTENTLGIWALGEMVKTLDRVPEVAIETKVLRDHFEKRVRTEISSVLVNHAESLRLPNTSSLIIDDVDGESLLMALDMQGFYVSTGAACSSGNPEPSPVLLAIGLSRREAQSSLRVSLGWGTRLEDVNAFVDTLVKVVERLRGIAHQYRESHV